MNSARAKELAKVKVPDIGLAEFRMKFGGDSVSDDDKLLNFFAGAEALAALKAAGAPKDYAQHGDAAGRSDRAVEPAPGLKASLYQT